MDKFDKLNANRSYYLITFTKKIIAVVYNFMKHKKDMKAFGVKLTVYTAAKAGWPEFGGDI